MTEVRVLIKKIMQRLSMMSGTGTQVYAEDKLLTLIQSTFNLCFDFNYWSRFTDVYEFDLDGSTGKVVQDLSKVLKSFTDVQQIFVDDKVLPKMSSNVNPFVYNGTTPLFYMNSNDDKIFKAVPFNSVGKVYVRLRVKPNDFDFNSVVPFDEDAIILGVCYEYSVDDDDNKLASQKFAEMFRQRLEALKSLENTGVTEVSGNYVIGTAWRV